LLLLFTGQSEADIFTDRFGLAFFARLNLRKRKRRYCQMPIRGV
jgi:hypothetical protein